MKPCKTLVGLLAAWLLTTIAWAATPPELIGEARAAYQAAEYRDALDRLRDLFTAPATPAQLAEGWGVAALAYYRLGDAEAARAAYSRAQSADPRFRFLALEQPREVIAFFEGDAGASPALSATQSQTPPPPSAAAWLAIENHDPPDDATVNQKARDARERGLGMVDVGEYGQAIPLLEYYLEASPGDAEAQRALAMARRMMASRQATPARDTDDDPGQVFDVSRDTRKAYQEYIAAYNHLTDLMSQGKGDTEAAKRAHEAYVATKQRYEESLKGENPVK